MSFCAGVYDRSPDRFYREVEHSRERERSPAHRHRSRSPRNKSPRKRSHSPRQRSRSPVGTERVRDRDRQKERDRDKGRKRSERDKKEGRLRRGVPPVVENMLSGEFISLSLLFRSTSRDSGGVGAVVRSLLPNPEVPGSIPGLVEG